MGFSPTGLLFSLLILAPNVLMLVFPPLNIPAELGDAGMVYTALERVGQLACMVLPVILKDCFKDWHFDLWLALAAVCIGAYYGLWIRYLVAGRDFALLFEFCSVPIPMAILPVCAFAFLALWGKSVWLGLATGLFAIGHIANSWNTYISIR